MKTNNLILLYFILSFQIINTATINHPNSIDIDENKSKSSEKNKDEDLVFASFGISQGNTTALARSESHLTADERNEILHYVGSIPTTSPTTSPLYSNLGTPYSYKLPTPPKVLANPKDSFKLVNIKNLSTKSSVASPTERRPSISYPTTERLPTHTTATNTVTPIGSVNNPNNCSSCNTPVQMEFISAPLRCSRCHSFLHRNCHEQLFQNNNKQNINCPRCNNRFINSYNRLSKGTKFAIGSILIISGVLTATILILKKQQEDKEKEGKKSQFKLAL